jgi:hypothetical protein
VIGLRDHKTGIGKRQDERVEWQSKSSQGQGQVHAYRIADCRLHSAACLPHGKGKAKTRKRTKEMNAQNLPYG